MSRNQSFTKINQAIQEIETKIKCSHLYDFQDIECVLVLLKKKLKIQNLTENEELLTQMAIENYVDDLDKDDYHLVISGDIFSTLSIVETVFLKDSFKKMNPDINVDFPAFSLDESFYKNMAIIAIPEKCIDTNRLRQVA